MWLRQHCITATGPGVSLEARRWRGRSRILFLSKASLGASGTRPITSTGYCVCFTRHSATLSLRALLPSPPLGLVWPGIALALVFTMAYEARGIGQEDSCFFRAPIAGANPPRTVFLSLQTSIWPIYRNMTGTLCTIRSNTVIDRSDLLFPSGGNCFMIEDVLRLGKFQIELLTK